jgi:hypothetical protein
MNSLFSKFSGGTAMNKLLSTLLAGAAVLALSGVAVAADQEQSGNQPAPQDQAPSGAAQPGSAQEPTQPGADLTAKEQEYLAGLKKCETLDGDQKQQCIDAAKKKAGEM